MGLLYGWSGHDPIGPSLLPVRSVLATSRIVTTKKTAFLGKSVSITATPNVPSFNTLVLFGEALKLGRRHVLYKTHRFFCKRSEQGRGLRLLARPLCLTSKWAKRMSILASERFTNERFRKSPERDYDVGAPKNLNRY